jgi:hypothetical protein
MEWDWDYHGEHASAEMSPGFTARMNITPDDEGVDVDDSVFTEAEIDDMSAALLHIEVWHQGTMIWDTYLGGVITLMSQSWQEARDHIESCAEDMLLEAPKPADLAKLMLPGGQS